MTLFNRNHCRAVKNETIDINRDWLKIGHADCHVVFPLLIALDYLFEDGLPKILTSICPIAKSLYLTINSVCL